MANCADYLLGWDVKSAFGKGGSLSYTITIPDVPPSLNKVLRMHWGAKGRLLEKWGWALKAAGLKTTAAVDVKRRVVITLCHSRFYDKDNAYGACKVILDALKTLGLIWDDKPEFADVDVTQEKCSHKTRHTVIEIGEAA